MELKLLTYTSHARPGITPADVDAILSSARVNNPLEGITGVLIFDGTSFMQILEGGQSAIDQLADRLSADPRHSNMTVREEHMVTGRTFPDWSMAYVKLADGEFEGEEEVTRALHRDLPPSLRNILVELTQSIAKS